MLFSLALSVRAESPCKKQRIEDLVKAIAEGYEANALRNLDVEKPYVGKIRIVIEHSLAEDDAKDRFVIKRFASLAKVNAWLRSREHVKCPAGKRGL